MWHVRLDANVTASEGNFVGTKRVSDEFQSESIANPVRGARAWLPWQSSSFNAAGVGSC